MTDSNYAKSSIEEILSESQRLGFVLIDKYGIVIKDIISIRIDRDNFKIDVTTEDISLRFKAKGTDSVLMKDPSSGILKLFFDPALAQGIYEICS